MKTQRMLWICAFFVCFALSRAQPKCHPKERDHVVIYNNIEWFQCEDGYIVRKNCIIKVHGNKTIEYVSADHLGQSYDHTPMSGYSPWPSVPQITRENYCSRVKNVIRRSDTGHNAIFQTVNLLDSICDIPTKGNGKVFILSSDHKWQECENGGLVHKKCMLPNSHSPSKCIPKSKAFDLLKHITGNPNPSDAKVCADLAALLKNRIEFTFTGYKAKNCFDDDSGTEFVDAFMTLFDAVAEEYGVLVVKRESEEVSKEDGSEKSVEPSSSVENQDQFDYSSLEQWQDPDNFFKNFLRREFHHPGSHRVKKPDSSESDYSENPAKSESSEEDSSHLNPRKFNPFPFMHPLTGLHYNGKLSTDSHSKHRRHRKREAMLNYDGDDESTVSLMEKEVDEPYSHEETGDSIVKYDSQQFAFGRYVARRPADLDPIVNYEPVNQQHKFRGPRPDSSRRYATSDDVDMSYESYGPRDIHPRKIYPRDNGVYGHQDLFDENESAEIEAASDFSTEEDKFILPVKPPRKLVKVVRKVTRRRHAPTRPFFPRSTHTDWESQSINPDSAESAAIAPSYHDSTENDEIYVPTQVEFDRFSLLFQRFSQWFTNVSPFLKVFRKHMENKAIRKIDNVRPPPPSTASSSNLQQQENESAEAGNDPVRRKVLKRRKLVRRPITRKHEDSTKSPIGFTSQHENYPTSYAPWWKGFRSTTTDGELEDSTKSSINDFTNPHENYPTSYAPWWGWFGSTITDGKLEDSTNAPINNAFTSPHENYPTSNAPWWGWWHQSSTDVPRADTNAPNVESADPYVTGNAIFGSNIEDSTKTIKKEESHSKYTPQYPSLSTDISAQSEEPSGNFYYYSNQVTSSPMNNRGIETTEYAPVMSKERKLEKSTDLPSTEPHVFTEIPQTTDTPKKITTEIGQVMTSGPNVANSGTDKPEISFDEPIAKKNGTEVRGKKIVDAQGIDSDAISTTESPVFNEIDASPLHLDKKRLTST